MAEPLDPTQDPVADDQNGLGPDDIADVPEDPDPLQYAGDPADTTNTFAEGGE